MPGEDIYSWSTTAASNGTADTSINWLEGQARASVNNSARSEMAAHAKNRDLQNGSIITTGSANAQAFASGVGYTVVPTGMRVLLKIGATNTGAATLSMDGILPTVIKTQFGSDLVGGELTVGSRAEFVYDGTNWVLLYSPVIPWTTGDAKLTFKIVADTGWILCDDGSIGNATSAATTRANADTEALFTLLYNNVPALVVQDSAGATVTRGTSAAVDYAANRRLVIPKVLGRALAVAGAGAGLTARVLGGADGAETHTQSIAELATHQHGSGGFDFAVSDHGFDNYTAGGGSFQSHISGFTAVTANQGSGTPMDIMNPRSYLNVIIKL